MSDPIITADRPASVVSGGSFDVQIHAQDPDAGQFILEARVLNEGGTVLGSLQFPMPVTAEAFGYALVDVEGAGFQIVQDQNDPSLFHCVAP